jgi:hypothetical protein|tara:strand:+ start:72 stop:278 length:207 start_codon:yes stop_codon:yes gene_type:complete
MDKQILQLVSSYKRVFKTPEGGEVLDDLRDFSQMDDQAGSTLTHSECAYRNGMQDMYRYIEALISENE